MPAFAFLEPQQFCLSNGGTFDVVHEACELRTESYFSITDAYLGYRVNFPSIGIGCLDNVLVWNDNYGVFKNGTYLLDTPAVIAGGPFYQVFRPHGIAVASQSHVAVPDDVTDRVPTRMPGRYVLLGTCLGNHSHMLEILTRCLLARDHSDWRDCRFVLASDAQKYTEIFDRYFPDVSPSYLVPEKDTLYEFETLYLPTSLQSWPALHPVGGRLLQEGNSRFIEQDKPPAGRRIYIDRRNASNRRVVNSDAVEDVLRKHGVAPVLLEEKTFAEQIEIFANASLIVGQHGAGQANAIFSPPGTQIVELMGYAHLVNFTHSAFWYSFQATALGHRHRSLVCESRGAANEAPKNMDIVVNPRELDAVLKAIG